MRDTLNTEALLSPPLPKTDGVPVGTEIVVGRFTCTRRSRDWHAFIDGNRTLWGCGKSPNEAIGSAYANNTELFEVSK